jgi:hypothetical protein
MTRLYDLSADLIRWAYDHRISGPPVLDIATCFPDSHRFVEECGQSCASALATLRPSVPRDGVKGRREPCAQAYDDLLGMTA